MHVKFIQDEDITNYKKCAMFIGLPYCTFKCEKECGKQICQNSPLTKSPTVEIDTAMIIKKYKQNFFTKAIVFGGLEPFDSFNDMNNLIAEFRKYTYDDIVIYTGYTEDELFEEIEYLSVCYSNIIIKFGRFKPDTKQHLDPILGLVAPGLGDWVTTILTVPYIVTSVFKLKSLSLTLAIIYNVLMDCL